jgi:hypothetical protein
MEMEIIIRGKNSYGKIRSEQEANLRKDGYVGMSDENYDKCRFLEKKMKNKTGSSENFFRQTEIDPVK